VDRRRAGGLRLRAAAGARGGGEGGVEPLPARSEARGTTPACHGPDARPLGPRGRARPPRVWRVLPRAHSRRAAPRDRALRTPAGDRAAGGVRRGGARLSRSDIGVAPQADERRPSALHAELPDDAVGRGAPRPHATAVDATEVMPGADRDAVRAPVVAA